MISKPHAGWCTFSLEDFTGTPSYLTDVPFDILEGLLSFWNGKKGTVVDVNFDEEGKEFSLHIERGNSYITMDDEKRTHIYIKDTPEELTSEIIRDLNGNERLWIDNFILVHNEEDENEKNLLEEKMKQQVKELKEIIKRARS